MKVICEYWVICPHTNCFHYKPHFRDNNCKDPCDIGGIDGSICVSGGKGKK